MVKLPSLKSLMKSDLVGKSDVEDHLEDRLVLVMHDRRFIRSVRLLLKGYGLERYSNKKINGFEIRKPYGVSRYPKDTSVEIDNYLENYRKRNYSSIASRQQGIFCFPVFFGKNKIDRLPFGSKKKGWNRAGMGMGSGYGSYGYLVLPSYKARVFQSYDVDDFYQSGVYNVIRDFLDGEDEEMLKDKAIDVFREDNSSYDFEDEAGRTFDEKHDVKEYMKFCAEEFDKKGISKLFLFFELHRMSLISFKNQAEKVFDFLWDRSRKKLVQLAQLDLLLTSDEKKELARKVFVEKYGRRLAKKEYIKIRAQQMYDSNREFFMEAESRRLMDEAEEEFIQNYIEEHEGEAGGADEDEVEQALDKYFTRSATSIEKIRFSESGNEVIVEPRGEHLLINVNFLYRRAKIHGIKSMVQYLWFLMRKL